MAWTLAEEVELLKDTVRILTKRHETAVDRIHALEQDLGRVEWTQENQTACNCPWCLEDRRKGKP